MFGIGVPELVIIMVVALVLFGPGKLPEIGAALGKGIRDFKRAIGGEDDESQGEPKRVDQKDETNPAP
jgi:sec-independent protein translocase protein TatA